MTRTISGKLQRFSLRESETIDRTTIETAFELLDRDDDYDVSVELVDHRWMVKILGPRIPESIIQLHDDDALGLAIDGVIEDCERGVTATYLR